MSQTRKGMIQFVQDKNRSHSQGQDSELPQAKAPYLEDLKLDHASISKYRTENNTGPPVRSSKSKAQPHNEHFDAAISVTDVGSVDRDGYANSTQGQRLAQDELEPLNHQNLRGNGDVQTPGEAFEDGIKQPHGALRVPAHPLSRGGTVRKQPNEHKQEENITLHRVDSYPATTSGEPSMLDMAERDRLVDLPPGRDAAGKTEASAAIQRAVGKTEASSAMPRRAGGRVPFRGQSLTMRDEAASHPNPAHRSPIEQDDSNLVNMIPGYTWRKAQPASLALQGRLQQVQDVDGTPGQGLREEQYSKSAPDARRRRNDRSAPGVPESSRPARRTPPAEPQQQQQQRQQLTYGVRSRLSQQQDQANLSEYGAEVEAVRREESPAESVMSLDYHISELYEKTFEEITAAPFDKPPGVPDLQLPDELESMSMHDRFHSVFTSNDVDHVQFMSSLDINDWEEAGDWFLEQFGNVLNRFKTARQKKRLVAQEFEQEIRLRHEAVLKKRKLTESTLDEMRESGGRVLDATPTKLGRRK